MGPDVIDFFAVEGHLRCGTSSSWSCAFDLRHLTLIIQNLRATASIVQLETFTAHLKLCFSTFKGAINAEAWLFK